MRHPEPERLTAENEHLHAQLDSAEAEIERLTVALEDETTKHRFLEAALNEEIADNKAVRRQPGCRLSRRTGRGVPPTICFQQQPSFGPGSPPHQYNS